MAEPRLIRKHMPSFTLALSTLLEESESPSSRYSLKSPASSKSDLMRTMDTRSERYFEYPVHLPDGDDTFDGLQDYDSETEVDYYDDLEDVTVYDEVPKMRFMFFRRLVWKMLRRCPECGEKLGPLEMEEGHLETTKKKWITSVFSSSSALDLRRS
ncbi:hypothetical protein FA13DRAFT_1784268 [Coprinellus micaceus]|uniref:Uncharacterized protein n=1 Tax=Coprinellus micaceus TaxID=71717 RepID=A0A4Y7U0F2_COPMI|nr:hypothetical protein FA13DRAFT_1784268 [Coprinellus micaceus]